MVMNDFTITSLDVITGFEIATGDYLFTLDELQNANISQSQEKTDITGKQGRKINSLKKNKAVTISGTNGLVSCGLLEMQTGSKFETKNSSVLWTDYLTVSSNTATTNFKAVGTVGAEIEGVYVKNADGTLGEALEQASSASSGKFSYAPATKKLTFNTSELADGTEIVVYYMRNISASVLENESDVYSKKCTLYIDATIEDKCSKVYHAQFYIPKADFNGEFSLEMGDNQSVHNFEAEALAGACGTGGSFWTVTIFGEGAADAT